MDQFATDLEHRLNVLSSQEILIAE